MFVELNTGFLVLCEKLQNKQLILLVLVERNNVGYKSSTKRQDITSNRSQTSSSNFINKHGAYLVKSITPSIFRRYRYK